MEDNQFDQAGGHPGSLIIEGDKLYKRCKQGEISFWEWFYEDHTDPLIHEFRNLAPRFYGTVSRDGHQYICIDNLLYGLRNACVMDCKLGRITWTKDHSSAKVESQSARAATTTTGSLGFRISGLVVKDSQGNKVEAWSKEAGYYSITADNIHEQFLKLVTKDGVVRLDIVEKLIEETSKLLDWFTRQKVKTFVTSSILYVTSDETPVRCQAKLIDFAHVYDGEGEVDNSKVYVDVIEGLTNVISIWERIKNLHKA